VASVSARLTVTLLDDQFTLMSLAPNVSSQLIGA
jgi:hypothetical protein